MGKAHILTPLERIEYIEKTAEAGGSGSAEVVIKDVAMPVMADSWVYDDALEAFAQTVLIKGLTETANPIILLSSVDEQASKEELDAYLCIKEANINEGSITFVADEKPNISITLIVKNVVASDSTAIEDITALVNKVNELEGGLKTLNSDLGTKLTMSGTYTPEMTLNDVYASMSNNTFFTFTAEMNSAIYTELGLTSTNGVRVFVNREHHWRGFAIGVVDGNSVVSGMYYAKIISENTLKWVKATTSSDLDSKYTINPIILEDSKIDIENKKFSFALWEDNALETPYKKGLTTSRSGVYIGFRIGNHHAWYSFDMSGNVFVRIHFHETNTWSEWKPINNFTWKYAGKISALGTPITLPYAWNECKLVDNDGFSTTIINTDGARTGYIQNTFMPGTDISLIIVDRTQVIGTENSVYVNNQNKNGVWQETLSQPISVFYR